MNISYIFHYLWSILPFLFNVMATRVKKSKVQGYRYSGRIIILRQDLAKFLTKKVFQLILVGQNAPVLYHVYMNVSSTKNIILDFKTRLCLTEWNKT